VDGLTNDAVAVFSGRLEPVSEMLLELAPRLRLGAPQEFGVFQRQFEGRGLESQVSAWRALENEPKVDVNDVTLPVKKKISIMTILDLEKI